MNSRDETENSKRRRYEPPVLKRLSEEPHERTALASVGTENECIRGSCTGISGCC